MVYLDSGPEWSLTTLCSIIVGHTNLSMRGAPNPNYGSAQDSLHVPQVLCLDILTLIL